MSPAELYLDCGRDIIARVLRGVAPKHRDDFRGVLHVAFMRLAEKWTPVRAATWPGYLTVRLRGEVRDEWRRITRCRTDGGKLHGPGLGIILCPLPVDVPVADTNDPREAASLTTTVELDPHLAALTPRERAVCQGWARGIEGGQLAREMGCTRSRISQLWQSAIHRLRIRFADARWRPLGLRLQQLQPVALPGPICLPVRRTPSPPRRAYRRKGPYARRADLSAVRDALAMLSEDPRLSTKQLAVRLGCDCISLRMAASRHGVRFSPWQTARTNVAQRLARWRAEGCPPVKEFCRREGITTQCFYVQRARAERLLSAA